MRGGWKCASTMSGGQCAMTLGVVLMLQWSAGNLDTHTLDVSLSYCTTTGVDPWAGTWQWSVLRRATIVDEIFGHPAQRTEAPNKYGLCAFKRLLLNLDP